jgi:hypothetical protein
MKETKKKEETLPVVRLSAAKMSNDVRCNDFPSRRVCRLVIEIAPSVGFPVKV